MQSKLLKMPSAAPSSTFVLDNGGGMLKVISEQQVHMLCPFVFLFVHVKRGQGYKEPLTFEERIIVCNFAIAGWLFHPARAEDDAELYHEGKV